MTPPVFAHGHLRLYLLRLLAERPMHGYEIIQALTEQSGGTYSPSAGTIYPRLGKLEEEGLVTKEADGRKTVYAITSAGRAELTARGDEIGGIEEEFSDSIRRLADEVRASVSDAMRTLRADLAAAARDVREETKQATDEAESVSRARLREAESSLAGFRADMRAELRHAAATGRSVDAAVETLSTGLRDLGRAITALLR